MPICQLCKAEDVLVQRIIVEKRGVERFVCLKCYERIEKENAALKK